MARWHVACDRCAAGAWIGPRSGALDAWCEACQQAAVLPVGAAPTPCPRCGAALTTGAPAFEELLSELQNLSAVLAAWDGDPAPLRALLPDRPRFLADWSPSPGAASDPAEVRAALESLERGRFSDARSRLDALLEGRAVAKASGRLWRARATAAFRLADPRGAEADLTRALEADPAAEAAWLDRGVLRASRGDFPGARADFARAGEGHEARWNRAALAVAEAVARNVETPDETLRTARELAPPPSAYWSDHTLGRLLMTLVIERALARGTAAATAADREALRRAARALEFDTFWDRSLVVYGCAALGMATDLADAAAPLCRELIAQLLDQPFARGVAGAVLARALEFALAAVDQRSPRRARTAVASLLARRDLIHFRIPCVSCISGSIGVDTCEEDEQEALR